jgi:hypothetical protein
MLIPDGLTIDDAGSSETQQVDQQRDPSGGEGYLAPQGYWSGRRWGFRLSRGLPFAGARCDTATGTSLPRHVSRRFRQTLAIGTAFGAAHIGSYQCGHGRPVQCAAESATPSDPPTAASSCANRRDGQVINRGDPA